MCAWGPIMSTVQFYYGMGLQTPFPSQVGGSIITMLLPSWTYV